jgi:hypothetical protein
MSLENQGPKGAGPISPEHERKLGYKKYAESRQINEIANG